MLVAAIGALAAGCGEGDEPVLSAVCTDSPPALERALLRSAPEPVVLAGGVRLSDCVSDARTDAELQTAGLVLTRLAAGLGDRAQAGDASAALALGYLVGAARRGAARTSGLQAELSRRVDRAAAYAVGGGPRVRDALARGMAAGRQTG
jgi:hypothetical protein